MEKWSSLLQLFCQDQWLKGQQGTTVASYLLHLRRVIYQLKDIRPVLCTPEDIYSTWTKILYDHPTSYKSKGSKKLLQASINAFISWNVAKGRMPCCTNFRWRIQERCFGEEKFTLTISNPETICLLQTIQQSLSRQSLRDVALLAIYAFTGVRRSEPLSLCVEDYERDHHRLLFRNKGGGVKHKFVPGVLKTQLERYIYYEHVKKAKQLKGKACYLFPGREGARHLSARQANNIFNKWKKEAGLRQGLTIHSFRSGFATNLYRHSKDFLLVSKALDHKDPMVTAKYIATDPLYRERVDDAFRWGQLLHT